MAVEACNMPNLRDDMDCDDDDEVPLVFKRSSSASKQNQSNSETKKLSQISTNGKNSSAQKGRILSSAKESLEKPTLTSSRASTSSTKGSPVTSLPGNSKPSTSATDNRKHLNQQNSSTATKKEKPSFPAEQNSDPDFSDDEKPLYSRFSAGFTKGNINNVKKVADGSSSGRKPSTQEKEDSDDEKPLSLRLSAGLTKENINNVKKEADGSSSGRKPITQEKEDSDDEKPLSFRLSAKLTKRNIKNVKKEADGSSSGRRPSTQEKEDSDDEKPLSTRFPFKSGAGESASKLYSDENKPLALKPQQNGSASRDSQVNISPIVSNNRPPGEIKSSSQSSSKKPKLSCSSTPLVKKQASVKAEPKGEYDDDHVPISQRIKKQTSLASKSSSLKKTTKVVSSSLKNANKKSKKVMKKLKYSKSSKVPPGSGEGQKWTTLAHNGVIFPPPYKPHGVKMLYKGQTVDLTPEQEEVATMYAVMLETDYMNKPQFKENFFSDWKKILGKNHVIQKLEDCDFTPILKWHQGEKEKKKLMTTEEKKALKEEKLQQEEKYMWTIVDGVKEKVGNFRVEPPGLFRGRGEHPKMGRLKRRIRPSDITINIGKDAPVPECPIPGQRWKEIRHDNTVTWLAFWNDPINPKEFKYVFLAASSTLKGQSDKEKYEKARLLKDYIQGIRAAYTKDFASKDRMTRQIAVATYLIDKLALRAGNEKDDEEADTVGCCTLKVENVEPVPPNILKFDFLGKDSIRYQNEVEVEAAVFKAIQQFRSEKAANDDLFDKLDTSKLNAHLKELMPCLTAKVFRTYNASITLDDMLSTETKGGDVAEKVVVYQHANKEVAIICNHQRTVSKSHSEQMSKLNIKIDGLKCELEGLISDLSRAKKGKPPSKGADGKPNKKYSSEILEKKIAQTNAKIEKMERDKETKEDLKTVALGTSKINYLDPRITVAWCKRHEVPIEKIFNKSLLAKFAWAMDVDPSFRF